MVRDGEPWFVNGQPVMRAEVADFWSVVFNPSTLERLSHTLIGAFIMGAFFIMSISAYYLLRGRHLEFAKRSFTGALIFATVFSVAQLLSGHSNAKMVAKYQPTKLAAFEAQYTTGPANLSLIGLPDPDSGKTHFDVAIPGMLSYLVHGDSTKSVIGLDAFPKEDWPPVVASFMSYHGMVGIGMFFVVLTLYASYRRWRGTLFEARWLLFVFIASVALAVTANQIGWFAAEVGRQPWIVQMGMNRTPDGWVALDSNGKAEYRYATVDVPGRGAVRVPEGLRTSDAVSEVAKAEQVLGSIVMFVLIYVLLGAVWLFVLNHKIHVGPEPLKTMPSPGKGSALIEMESRRVEHADSMTEAKQPATGG
jgi:cytochrome d ubiquinol oxidase subunit I